MTRLDTVIIFTARMSELAAFYQEALKLGEPTNNGPQHVGWALGATYFGIDQIDDVAQGEPTLRGPSVWFAVNDLDATFTRCVLAGSHGPLPAGVETDG